MTWYCNRIWKYDATVTMTTPFELHLHCCMLTIVSGCPPFHCWQRTGWWVCAGSLVPSLPDLHWKYGSGLGTRLEYRCVEHTQHINMVYMYNIIKYYIIYDICGTEASRVHKKIACAKTLAPWNESQTFFCVYLWNEVSGIDFILLKS